MSDDRTIADEDRLDENDNTADGYIRRLGRIERILTKTNNRLEKLIADVGAHPPPDDEKPGVLTAATDVRSAAQATVDAATQLQALLR